jgi:hypothetical protein
LEWREHFGGNHESTYHNMKQNSIIENDGNNLLFGFLVQKYKVAMKYRNTSEAFGS